MNKENKDVRGYHCWVKNRTKDKIVIGDLRVTLPPYMTLDLLDYKRSNLSVEQVEKSIEGGSLFRRLGQNKILIKMSKPEAKPTPKVEISNAVLPKPIKSNVRVEEKRFKELELECSENDENKFANKHAESAAEEHSPKINLPKEAIK